MEYDNKKLSEYQKFVFNFALYKTGSIEAANDITSQTINLYLLKADTIEEEHIKGWLIQTSKKYCQAFFRSEKKETQKQDNYRHEIMEQLYEQQAIGRDEALKEAFQDSFKALNDHELKTIFYYFQCNENIKEMHNMINISYTVLRKQISRIKNKLKAETYKVLGVIATKKIVTPQVNNLIVKFLRRFKTNLENNSLEKMYYYFSEVDLKKYNPSYEIKKILDYEIELIDSIYKVWIFFKNKKDETDSFFIKFYIDKKNHLKILTPPQKPSNVFKFKEDSEEGKRILKILNSAPIDRTGVSKFSDEELEKILKQIEKTKNKE